jgi:hypothetical protein
MMEISVNFYHAPQHHIQEDSNVQCHYCESGPGSVVGTVTGYELDIPGIESRWEARFSTPVRTSPGAPPGSCTMGTRSFPRVKSGRGITLTPHPLLVPWLRKGRAIPLLPLWAIRPVQSLSVCTRVQFTFTFYYCENLKFHITYTVVLKPWENAPSGKK